MEDETRSVAVGYGEVGLSSWLDFAFARKREGGPEGTEPAATRRGSERELQARLSALAKVCFREFE
jgi:hypothetical protein